MPLYTYECPICEIVFESIKKYEEIVLCPKCNNKTQKIPSVSNFHLKGDCWAKDGYSKK